MQRKRLTAALVSSRSRFCDVQANLRHCDALVKRAGKRGARFVCFPELSLTGCTCHRAVFSVAEPVPGPAVKVLERIAHQSNTYLSTGMVERSRGRFYNCQVVVGPDGYMGRYRKHHLWPPEKDAGFTAGRTFDVFDIDGFTLGVNICYDDTSADTIEAMKRAHVDMVHHACGHDFCRDAEEWSRRMLATFVPRAIHARAYMLVNNPVGFLPEPDGGKGFPGGALVLDPSGQVVKRTVRKTQSEGTLVAELVRPE